MISTTIGIIPSESAAYAWITRFLLPASLLLLLISANIPDILKLGKTALAMVSAGTLGVVIGGPLSLLIFKQWLPPDAWKGVGALSGSWIGGSSNMMAIAEGIGTPPELLGPLIIVDTVVGYSWMGIIISLSVYQDKFDRWNRADRAALDEINARLDKLHKEKSRPIKLIDITSMLGLAFVLGLVCLKLGEILPPVGKVITSFTWTIIIVIALGLVLSFTRVSSLEDAGASTVGYAGIYILLASIGARADLMMILEFPVFMLLGIVWILIHGVVLFAAARVFKAPLFFFATGSQANIGGTSSAPVVAAIYQSALAPVGLLMAVFGNIIGVYAGLLTTQLSSMI